MRPPARIEPWLDKDKMFAWLQKADDKFAYQKRLAIWLTAIGRLHAPKVAQMLGVSTQAIWKWISQYNKFGPGGLWRQGRGGRKWAFLTEVQEANIMEELLNDCQDNQLPTAKQIQKAVEAKLNRKVSLSYIYRMRHRHHWPQIASLHHQRSTRTTPISDFTKISRPWLR